MVSCRLLIGALACLAANGVDARACHRSSTRASASATVVPSSIDTPSASTPIPSTSSDIAASFTSPGSVQTTPVVSSDTDVESTPTSTPNVISSVAPVTTPSETPSASSSAIAQPTTPVMPTSCSVDDDCLANVELCLANGLNMCNCVDAVCVVSTPPIPTTTTAPAPIPDIECSTDQDCVAAIGADALGVYACIDLLCQKTATAPIPASTTTAAAGQPTTSPGESCIDSNDCLLSSNPLCALGLCECTQSVCTVQPAVQRCSSTTQCAAGATCQTGVCVDDTACSGAQDCMANLDVCFLPGSCTCANGVCRLGGIY